jgi:hypothetical protein
MGVVVFLEGDEEMTERRDDPMRLWIGKWTPERPIRPLPAEKSDEKRPAPDTDRASTAD